MDLEITMVLISNTLACIFVGLQLFYGKKNSDVLPFISVVMLIVLNLAHMIPLLLNFEAMFLANRKQNVFLGSDGWLEVNEVLVRIITMIHPITSPSMSRTRYGYPQWVYFWGEQKSYAALVLDGFLLPQIVLNLVCDSTEKALTPCLYVGSTMVRFGSLVAPCI